jgi:hypothetical protein
VNACFRVKIIRKRGGLQVAFVKADKMRTKENKYKLNNEVNISNNYLITNYIKKIRARIEIQPVLKSNIL